MDAKLRTRKRAEYYVGVSGSQDRYAVLPTGRSSDAPRRSLFRGKKLRVRSQDRTE